jgi:excisionase family DNA binding protein
MSRWLTLFDVCAELRLGRSAVLGMLRHRQLVGFRLPRCGRSKWGEWRILDPSAALARYVSESQRHIEHVPLLSTQEAAELLSVSPGAIRQLKRRGRLHGTKIGTATLYAPAEIRRFLFWRERRSRQGKRKMYSAILVAWARGLAKQDEHVSVQVLDSLLRQAVAIPEPAKSQYIVEVWDHFDAINSLLRSARTGEDIGSALKRAKSKDPVQEIQIAGVTDAIEFLKEKRPA